jgi:hypothetical protein
MGLDLKQRSRLAVHEDLVVQETVANHRMQREQLIEQVIRMGLQALLS